MNRQNQEGNGQSARRTRGQFDADGFAFVRQALASSEVQELRDELSPLLKGGRAGVRNLLQRSNAVAQLAQSHKILALLGGLTTAPSFPVRGILFDKTTLANWQVGWHQDSTIAVRARAELPGFGPWSVKEGIIHVQAPGALLGRMLTVRIHLDDADRINGALQVIPGSHRLGKLEEKGIAEAVSKGPIVSCAARSGDVLIMRPLLLHASSSTGARDHRRIIHLEYAMDCLPEPLEWFERSQCMVRVQP